MSAELPPSPRRPVPRPDPLGKFQPKKRHVNIGTIGHVDHGRTTLTASSPRPSPSSTGSTSRSKERASGITINTASIEHETEYRHYALVDCPSHADHVTKMITGAAQMDGAILVVSGADGTMLQTNEQILPAKQVGVPNTVVLFNNQDQVDTKEFLQLVELEVLILLRWYRPQFYMKATDDTGRISSIMNDNDEDATMVIPGDRVKMEAELIMRL